MVGNDRREHIRTAMSAKVKVVHAEQGEFIFVQVQGLPVPAPVLEMVVVRKTNDGYGLQFDQNGD